VLRNVAALVLQQRYCNASAPATLLQRWCSNSIAQHCSNIPAALVLQERCVTLLLEQRCATSLLQTKKT
jgi:hypothetical protein